MQAGTRKKGVGFPLENVAASAIQRGGTQGKGSAWWKTLLRCAGNGAEGPHRIPWRKTEQRPPAATFGDALTEQNLHEPAGETKGVLSSDAACFPPALRGEHCSALCHLLDAQPLMKPALETVPPGKGGSHSNAIPAVCCSSSPAAVPKPSMEQTPCSPLLMGSSRSFQGQKAQSPAWATHSHASSEITSLAVVWIATALPSHGNGIPACQQVPMKCF